MDSASIECSLEGGERKAADATTSEEQKQNVRGALETPTLGRLVLDTSATDVKKISCRSNSSVK